MNPSTASRPKPARRTKTRGSCGERRAFSQVLAYYRATVPHWARRGGRHDREFVEDHFGRWASLRPSAREATDQIGREAFIPKASQPYIPRAQAVNYKMCMPCGAVTAHVNDACPNKSKHRESYCGSCDDYTLRDQQWKCLKPTHIETVYKYCSNCQFDSNFRVSNDTCTSCNKKYGARPVVASTGSSRTGSGGTGVF